MSALTKWALLLILLATAFACQKEEILPSKTEKDTSDTIEFRYRHDASTSTSADERTALVDFYTNLESTGTLVWQVADPGSDPCVDSWEGVTCDGGRVIYLNLRAHYGLSGPLSESLGNLMNLEVLSLSENNLTGSIPIGLGNLENLKAIYLGDNNFTNSIPPELANLNNLEVLSLWGNNLSGSIPPELGDLEKLESLEFSGNNLTGSIPIELGNLENLKRLGLNYNNLSGSIPIELGNLENLEYLYLRSNDLTGSIISELGNLKKLEGLYLAENNLVGSIPPDLANLEKFRFLYLNENNLTGSIPAVLGGLANLENLGLAHNQFQCYESGLEMLALNSPECDVSTEGNPGTDGTGLPTWTDFINHGAGTCIPPADEQIESIEDQVSDGISDGTVSAGGSSSLFNQLNQATTALCEGDVTQAIHKLEVFITLVEAKMPRKIDPVRGGEMINAAQAVIDQLERGDFEVDCS